jgi:hypothetical protein
MRKLDQQGSFEVTGSHETVLDQHPKEMTILDLGEKALVPSKTPAIDISSPIIIRIYSYECQTLSHVAMETNAATSSGNSSIPTTVVTTGDIPPPNPLSPI